MNEYGLKITTDANANSVNFLDATFYLKPSQMMRPCMSIDKATIQLQSSKIFHSQLTGG